MTMLPLEVTLDQMIACVEREIAMRHKVYAGQVDRGKMRPAKAEMEIEQMLAVLSLLKSLCPVTMQAHRFDQGACVDCRTKTHDETTMWKCPHCRLTVAELSTVVGPKE